VSDPSTADGFGEAGAGETPTRKDRVVITRRIQELGGIATTAELLSSGYSRRNIEAVVGYGRVIRVRRGVYALRELPPEILEACRIGGRLTCVSALAFHGIIHSADDALHVEVAANASRLRSPTGSVVLHWSGAPAEGTRLVVGVGPALAQSARCHGGRR